MVCLRTQTSKSRALRAHSSFALATANRTTYGFVIFFCNFSTIHYCCSFQSQTRKNRANYLAESIPKTDKRRNILKHEELLHPKHGWNERSCVWWQGQGQGHQLVRESKTRKRSPILAPCTYLFETEVKWTITRSVIYEIPQTSYRCVRWDDS